MAVINHDTREVSFKLVYCGTPLGGKTTNLNHIHSRIRREQRGDMVTLATSGDRTLFFDFLPVRTMVINGYRTKFMLYTVPGQVRFNVTRQMVLRGVDGIVFVADSHLDRMEENLAALHGLRRNLEENGLSLDTLPAVLQLNKRDLPATAPVNYLEYLLNNGPRRLPVFEAAATSGYNVFATLNALAQGVLRLFHQASSAAVIPA
ncbi:MAG: GTPase domain-containing protein [Verrucomicrobiota bacterium]